MIKYKKTYIITIVIAAILITTIGVTFSYFSTKMIGNDQSSTHLVTSASRLLRYTDLQLLNNQKMEPGFESSKTMTVQNVGTKDLAYDLIWQNATNGLTRKVDLEYSMTCTSNISGNTCLGKAATQFPSTGTNINILAGVDLAVGEKHVYVITIKYINQPVADQSADMNKSISGQLGAVDLP